MSSSPGNAIITSWNDLKRNFFSKSLREIAIVVYDLCGLIGPVPIFKAGRLKWRTDLKNLKDLAAVFIFVITMTGDIGEHYNALRERRKRQKLENSPRRRCWDWMIVSGHCHYAKNRSSFKTYQHLGKHIHGSIIRTEVPRLFVAGVGTVELKVRSDIKKGSPDHTLILENVLHIPDAPCNGFCWAKHARKHKFLLDTGAPWRGIDREGKHIWYSVPFCGLQKLALAGNPRGESYLKSGELVTLSIYLTDEDRTTVFGAERP